MAVAFQAVGTAATGTATVAPAWPTHVADDVGVLVIQSGDANATLDTANGFTLRASAGASGFYLTVYTCLATSASMSAPVVTDMGDHNYARIFTLRGCASAVPNAIATGMTSGSETSYSTGFKLNGVTTTVDDCGIAVIPGWGGDTSGASINSYTCGGITGLTEQFDAGTTNGTGGGIAMAFGTQDTAGATGYISCSAYVLSVPFIGCVLAFEPAASNTSVTADTLSATWTLNAPQVTTADAFWSDVAATSTTWTEI